MLLAAHPHQKAGHRILHQLHLLHSHRGQNRSSLPSGFQKQGRSKSERKGGSLLTTWSGWVKALLTTAAT